jgi:Zn-finger nucleic acid-binding protein
MRSYERNGVTIDQCTGCRGVFLDRGELERLVDAESAFYAGRQPGHEQPYREQPYRRDHDDDDDDHDRHRGDGYGHGRKRKGGFLDELFG